MDRNLYKSDKKLASQGWRAMRKALDQEMPEERRRRPVVLIWIFALLVPAAGALGWLMFERSAGAPSTVVDRTPVVTPKVSVQDKQIANIPEENNRTAATGARHEIISSQHPGSISEKTKRPLSSSTYQTGSPHFNDKTAREPGALNTTQNPRQQTGVISASEPVRAGSAYDLAEILNPASENKAQQIAIREPAGAGEILLNGEPAAVPGKNVISDVSAPSAAADTASAAPFVMPPKPIDPLRDNKKPAWAFGANAGVMSDAKGAYAGAGAGLSAEWQPLKNWGLRSGVGYQFRQLGAEERPVVALTAMSYVDLTGDLRVAADNNNFQPQNGSTQSSTEPSQVYVPIGRLHRIEMPVLGFWQPFSKLRVFGGVAIGNNLYVETGNRTLNNNKVYTVLDGDAGKKLNGEVSAQFREWDTRWSIGVGFKPVRHLELGLFFHKPLPSGRFGAIDQDVKLDNASVNFQEAISGKSSGLTTNGLFNFTASWFF